MKKKPYIYVAVKVRNLDIVILTILCAMSEHFGQCKNYFFSTPIFTTITDVQWLNSSSLSELNTAHCVNLYQIEIILYNNYYYSLKDIRLTRYLFNLETNIRAF